jgi:hypothetical protein
MSEPKTPSFNGVEIREGDMLTVHVKVENIDDHGRPVVQVHNADGGQHWGVLFPLPSQDCGGTAIATHTPAPRPLVPGPALFGGNGVLVTVKAVVGDRAWVRGNNGTEVVLDAEDTAKLRNTEGAAS